MRSIRVNTNNKINLSNIIVRPFTIDDLRIIHQIIESHILHTYSKVYCDEITEFYKEYHSEQNILKDSELGTILILLVDDEIIATGTIVNNYINRMFVKPGFQNKGYGTVILSELEKMSDNKKKHIILDAVPGSEQFYIKNGYTLICQAFDKVGQNYLEYFKFKKLLE